MIEYLGDKDISLPLFYTFHDRLCCWYGCINGLWLSKLVDLVADKNQCGTIVKSALIRIEEAMTPPSHQQ